MPCYYCYIVYWVCDELKKYESREIVENWQRSNEKRNRNRDRSDWERKKKEHEHKVKESVIQENHIEEK